MREKIYVYLSLSRIHFINNFTMLQNIEGIYYLNNVSYTGTAYMCGTQGIFFTSSEKCLSLAPDKDVIYMYEFENGVIIEF